MQLPYSLLARVQVSSAAALRVGSGGEKVELKTSFKDADKKSLRTDKRYFSAYTSSNAKHHFQTKVPTKFILALCVILGAGILVYRAYERYAAEKAQAATATSAPAGSMVDQVRDTVGSFIKPAGEAKPMRRKAPPATSDGACLGYPAPSSAPIYDELTRPVSFPRLYCMSSTDPATYAREFGRMAHAVVNGTPTVCQCYTQQSTRVETDFAFCMRVVENGFFDPTLPDRSPARKPSTPKTPATDDASRSRCSCATGGRPEPDRRAVPEGQFYGDDRQRARSALFARAARHEPACKRAR